MGWHLVEWLDRSEKPSLVWKDGAARDHASMSLIERRDGLRRRDLDRLVNTALQLPAGSFQDREVTPLMSSQIPGKQGPRTVELHHVVGPDRVVVGLQLWIGAVDEPVASRPRAAGIRFRPESRALESGKDAWMVAASNLDRYYSGRPADQLFNRAVCVPNVGEIMDLALSKDPQVTDLRTDVSLLHEELRLVNATVIARRRGLCAWAIGMDTTRWITPLLSPEIALRMSGLPSDTSRGILTFGDDQDLPPALMFWTSEPPKWTAYWAEGYPYPDVDGTLLHVDDRKALNAARDRIGPESTTVTTTVRMRHLDGSWVPVEASLSRYPCKNPNVFVLEFSHE